MSSIVHTNEKIYVSTIIAYIHNSLPIGAKIEWNGLSYSVEAPLERKDLSKILDAVSRTFWDATSLVSINRPTAWNKEYNTHIYRACAWLTEPIDGKEAFLIGESYYIHSVKPEHSLLEYTFNDMPIVRSDSFASSLQESLGGQNKVCWNGRGYTINTDIDTEANGRFRFVNNFFREARNNRFFQNQVYPLTFNEERILNPDGHALLGITLYEDVPFSTKMQDMF